MARKKKNPKPTLDVSETELTVLDVLWEQRSATIRQIAETVYGDTAPASIGTVQKLLERLESKNCVRRDRDGFAHVFYPTVERSDLIDHGLASLAERLCAGSVTPLLVHLVESQKLSQDECDMLRQMIERSNDGDK